MTPTYQESTAIGMPTSMVMPMLPPSASAAATGPGCGGVMACMATKAPAAGSAYSSREPPKRRATVRMMGRNTTRPASKKMGKPKHSAATPRASGALRSPNPPISVFASTWAPPVTSSSRPSITPNATSRATEPRVLEKP